MPTNIAKLPKLFSRKLPGIGGAGGVVKYPGGAGTLGRKSRWGLARLDYKKRRKYMDADHFGWVFPAWLLISPILFVLFIPSGGPSVIGRPDVVGRLDLGHP